MTARAYMLVLVAATAGRYCSAVAAETNAVSSWPVYHGDAALSGVAGTSLPDKLMVLWRHKVGAGVSVSPVIGGNMIFFVAENGYLSALTPQGEKIWSRGIEKDSVSVEAGNDRARKFVTQPLFIRDTIVTGSDDGWLYAMESATGKILWRYKVGQSINGTANWLEQAGDSACGIVVISQWDGKVHCIDLVSGKARWTSPEVAECDGSPGIGSDFVVFGSCDMALHMLSSSKGAVLGSVSLGDEGQVAGGVAVSGSLAFAGTYNGTIACADVRKKTIVWTNRVAKAEAFATPAVTTDRVVAGSNDGFVYCLDRRDGKKVWGFNAGDTVLSPVVAGDKIVVSSGGTLYFLKLQDGSKVWSVKAGDRISSPAVADGKVVIGTDDGFIIMYGATPAIK